MAVHNVAHSRQHAADEFPQLAKFGTALWQRSANKDHGHQGTPPALPCERIQHCLPWRSLRQPQCTEKALAVATQLGLGPLRQPGKLFIENAGAGQAAVAHAADRRAQHHRPQAKTLHIHEGTGEGPGHRRPIQSVGRLAPGAGRLRGTEDDA